MRREVYCVAWNVRRKGSPEGGLKGGFQIENSATLLPGGQSRWRTNGKGFNRASQRRKSSIETVSDDDARGGSMDVDSIY